MSYLRQKKAAGYKVMEVNQMLSLRAGHALAQVPANAKNNTIASVDSFEYENTKCVENAVIVGIRGNVLTNFDSSKHSHPAVIWNEELITNGSIGLNNFAAEADADGTVYLRAIPLHLGDAFTTNNYAGTLEDAAFAKVVDGIITLETEQSADSLFSVIVTTMPNGTDGVELTYEGLSMVGGAE